MKAFQFFIFVAIIAAVAAIVLSIPSKKNFSGAGGIMLPQINSEVYARSNYINKSTIDTLILWGAICIPTRPKYNERVDILYHTNPIQIIISPTGKWFVK